LKILELAWNAIDVKKTKALAEALKVNNKTGGLKQP